MTFRLINISFHGYLEFNEVGEEELQEIVSYTCMALTLEINIWTQDGTYNMMVASTCIVDVCCTAFRSSVWHFKHR